MQVLVDTSIWIDYFKSAKHSAQLDFLIDENIVVINDLILAELIPFLEIKKENNLISLLQEIRNIPMTIDWENIIKLQVTCIKNSINKVGIPDLMIAQNAKEHNCEIYTLDKHFTLISQFTDIKIYTI